MTEAEISARIVQLSELPDPNGHAWNHLWVIQARQVVLLEQILAELQKQSPKTTDSAIV